MAVLLVLIPICFFAAERMTALVLAATGINLYVPFLCVFACMSAVAAYVSYKKKIKNLIYIICTLIGVPLGFLTAGITCAVNILSKIGGGISICLYITVIIYFLRGLKPKKPSMGIWIFTAAILAVANICAALYANSCEYIYYWDNATYWTFARDIAGGSMKNNFFSILYDSILTSDYNYIAALIPALFAYLFGTSRTVYIFAVVNFFFVPGAVAIYACTKNAFRACAVILMLPVLIFLALTGFVDVVGFALCMICFAVYNGGRDSWKRGFAIGTMLALAILIRRWYAFFAVSFIVSMAIDCIISEKNIKCLFAALLNTGFILMMFFSPLVINKLLADYSSLYAGYKFSLMTDIRLFARYFGVIPAVFVLAGGIWCIIKKDKRVIMPFVQMAICFLMFIRVQTHGQQHLLLYVPGIAVMIAYTLEKLNKRVCAVVLAGAVCVSANTLVDRVQPQSLSEIKHLALIPDFSMRGRIRDDVHEILEMKNTLDLLYSDSRVGVNLSSFIINPDILRNVQPSLGEKDFEKQYLVELPCVDSRDRDMTGFYDVDYILTSDPVQLHLGEDKQKVVVAADKCLREKTAFGAAYEIEDISFDINGIKCSIYKRISEVTEEQKAEFEAMLFDVGA